MMWLGCATGVARAQTPEQMQIFSGLTPEQQQAVMQSVSQSSAVSGTDSGPSATGDKVAAASRAKAAAARAPIKDSVSGTKAPGGAVKKDDAKKDESPAIRIESNDGRIFGIEGLPHYGYDLFDDVPSTFAPVTDVPVPADYVVGPGDQITFQLYGNTNRTTRLVVTRDGRINVPEFGPINVGGKSFSSVQSELETRVEKQLVGVHASVSMADTRSIRVFVLGEATRPGSYTVSGLSTMTGALFASGGVKSIGSLRSIQLKRQGNIVRTLDLYDLLMKGDTSNDTKLLPGDVIYAPTVGPTVAVQGGVKRPAIYELKGNEKVSDVIKLAGGLAADADASKVSLVRIDASGKRTVMDVNLNQPARAATTLRNGDALSVATVPSTLDSGIVLVGHVHAARTVAWHQGLRLTDVIDSVDALKPKADLHYVLIRREVAPDRHIEVLSADLSKALAERGGGSDVVLQARDRITVFDLQSDRAAVIKPVLEELKLQSQALNPTQSVSIGGRVKAAGEYPLEPGMKISDLIRAGGGLDDAAYTVQAELIRHSITAEGAGQTQILSIQLAALANGDASANIALQPADELNVKQLPDWQERAQVTLTGEFRFPGTYTVRRGETLRSLIDRAGGLTEKAYAAGSAFTREAIREKEQETIDTLARRMQNDLATTALQAAQVGQAAQSNATQATVGQQLISQLKSATPVGRLVIDLDQILRSSVGSDSDLALVDGDALMVPPRRADVSVVGEVQSPASHLFAANLGRADYIAKSGGVTRKADTGRIYVVRANGAVATGRSRLFGGSSVMIEPGDSIVVPLDTERMNVLPLWQAVTQIIYNTAIAAAAVHSF
jgi:protein involved in polysaccharide export with SLBB domain